MRNLLTNVLTWLTPDRCGACEAPAPAWAALCDACAVSLVPGAEVCCPICGLIYLDPPAGYRPGAEGHRCGRCLKQAPPWIRARGAFAYGAALRDAIRRWKSRPDPALGPRLATLMASQAVVAGWHSAAGAAGVVVPVPSPRRRVARRGFNPAGVLARQLAKALNAPFDPTALRLTRRIAPARGVVSLKARERRMRNAFVVARPAHLAGANVLLVDDVMTTGATARAATRALLAAGVVEVEVAALARVPRA